MKKQLFLSLFLVALSYTAVMAQNSNTLTDQEKKEGWVLLFDGKNFNGWRKCNASEMPANWTIDDNAMKVGRNNERPGHGQGGDILFGSKKYANFEFSIDWKIEKQGNSGIFYYVAEYPGKPIYFAAPEIQVLDNWNASDNKLTNHLAGSLYDILPALPQNARPAGQWNTIVVKVKDGKVTHTQNGVKVVEYELWTPTWYEMVANSKFKDWEGFKEGPAKEGYIGLQDHGYDCWFRNIKIREL
ncbi:DUF1080 domain-containing protein [Parabacteroides sp. PF5-9]|uniref:3-keto-disaccharide hydrolase n=1 Tax=Parabacteroides sp. PF5-9 TaxID=1742404 RepID=UPI002475DB01|nr:DUF1080 domain-containing protein [Parabacteroides sp. PF5-9]MDH6356290.1 hypothetical protein [Parabacteroides sp. PF5-9]